MKIAIAPIDSSFLNFFINIAKYLEQGNNSVTFINPDKYNKIMQKYNLNFIDYPKISKSEIINFYNENDKIARYKKNLLKIKNTQFLLKFLNKKYTIASKFFSKNDFDFVLFWNGEATVEKDVCKALKIKTFFFENGYFSNTLQMNREGVNNEAEYSSLSLENLLKFNYNFIAEKQNKFSIITIKTNRLKRRLYRLFDENYYNFFFNHLLYNYKLFKVKKTKKQTLQNFDLNSVGDFIFVPLQVNTDTQIILNSEFNNIYEMLERCLPILKNTKLKIILKEHPAEIEKTNYLRFIDNKEVFIVNNIDIDKLIEKSSFVFCVNSSVGMQSIEKYKKVVIIGNAFYQNAPNCIKINTKENNLLEKVNNCKIDKNKIDNYISHFKKDIFIKGNWRNITGELLESIKNRICA